MCVEKCCLYVSTARCSVFTPHYYMYILVLEGIRVEREGFPRMLRMSKLGEMCALPGNAGIPNRASNSETQILYLNHVLQYITAAPCVSALCAPVYHHAYNLHGAKRPCPCPHSRSFAASSYVEALGMHKDDIED